MRTGLQKKSDRVKYFDELILSIRNSLSHIETDIQHQKDLFYASPEYKKYKGTRDDKGYNNWKEQIQDRFQNTCCVCLSQDSLEIHHLYSYKYYPALRTDVNNGVCLCTICHLNFNDIFSTVSTLDQFIKFRDFFKNKKRVRIFIEDRNRYREIVAGIKLRRYKSEKSDEELSPTIVSDEEQKIIDGLEKLRDDIFQEMKSLEKKYGYEKGIKINFRDKSKTSLAAIKQLLQEVMRINTLINCVKFHDKKSLSEKFFMEESLFIEQISDPSKYLMFSDAEITHLNRLIASANTI